MQQRKTIIILSLIVLLPLLLLSWQSWKMSKDDQQVNSARFENLVSARLDRIDSLVQSYFEETQLKLGLMIPQWTLSTDGVRKIIKNDGSIRQIFVIDENKQRRLPSNNTALTVDEQTLINRLTPIWRDPQMLFSNQADAQANEKMKSNTQQQYSKKSAPRISSKISPALKSARHYGWYLWHWEGGANLIYWQQNHDRTIVGVELEPIRVKSDLISRLPNTSAADSSSDFRLKVLDTAGHIVYQWGNYAETESSDAQQKYALSYPLSSWSLEYHGKPFTPSSSSRVSLLVTLIGFGLLIAGLAWFLYREQTREIRLATQRVQFVSQVSHELKTPLTNIRMYAEMLEDQLEDEPQQRRYLQIITDESQRLSRLIANVLNFSRTPRIHKRNFDINSLIQQSIAHFKPSFDAKNITLMSKLEAKGEIFSDPDAIEQIINNLLSNVEKYAAEGKQLDIDSEIQNEQLILWVRDYGKGIPRSERKRIFQPFYRINSQLTEGVSGTGIGLAIARQQAEKLGGSLVLADVKTGSCFQLTIEVKK